MANQVIVSCHTSTHWRIPQMFCGLLTNAARARGKLEVSFPSYAESRLESQCRKITLLPYMHQALQLDVDWWWCPTNSIKCAYSCYCQHPHKCLRNPKFIGYGQIQCTLYSIICHDCRATAPSYSEWCRALTGTGQRIENPWVLRHHLTETTKLAYFPSDALAKVIAYASPLGPGVVLV